MRLCRCVDDGAKSNAALFIADLTGIKSFATDFNGLFGIKDVKSFAKKKTWPEEYLN